MPGSFRSSSAAVFTLGASVDVTKPTGVADGDLLIAVGYCATGWTLSPPSGWTEIESVSGSVRNGKVWTKTAGGSEPATYVFPVSPGGHNFGIAVAIAAYQDVGDVEDSSITEAASGTTATAPGVTSGGGSRFLLFYGLVQSSGDSLDPGGGWTARLNVTEAGGAAGTQDGVTFFEKTVGAGATGNVSATVSSAYGGHVAGLVVFPDTPLTANHTVGMARMN